MDLKELIVKTIVDDMQKQSKTVNSYEMIEQVAQYLITTMLLVVLGMGK